MRRYFLYALLCLLSLFQLSYAKEEEKKLTIEESLHVALTKAELFEWEYWKPIKLTYEQATSPLEKQSIALAHYKKLYRDALKAHATKKAAIKGVETIGIAGLLALSFFSGDIAGFMGYDQMTQAKVNLAGRLGCSVGSAFWGALQLSPSAMSEHSPTSLIKDTVNYSRYALGRGLEDPYLQVDEVFAEAYFRLADNHPDLFEKTKARVYQMRQDDKAHVNNYLQYVETAAALPLGNLPFQLDEERYYSVFEHYSEQVVDAMALLVSSKVYWSELASGRGGLHFPYYFEGEPGTGKTNAVRALSKVMKTQLFEAHLDGANYEKIVGQRFDPSLLSERGRLLEAFCASSVKGKTNGQNAILFIDEFDRLLNADDYESRQVLSFMLKALDPRQNKFYSPYLGVHVPFPNLVILSGNHRVTDAALVNRFEKVEFDGFNAKAKRRITESVLVPDVLQRYGFEQAQLEDGDREAIDQLLMSDQANRGLRQIEKGLTKIIGRKVARRYFTAR